MVLPISCVWLNPEGRMEYTIRCMNRTKFSALINSNSPKSTFRSRFKSTTFNIFSFSEISHPLSSPRLEIATLLVDNNHLNAACAKSGCSSSAKLLQVFWFCLSRNSLAVPWICCRCSAWNFALPSCFNSLDAACLWSFLLYHEICCCAWNLLLPSQSGCRSPAKLLLIIVAACLGTILLCHEVGSLHLFFWSGSCVYLAACLGMLQLFSRSAVPEIVCLCYLPLFGFWCSVLWPPVLLMFCLCWAGDPMYKVPFE